MFYTLMMVSLYYVNRWHLNIPMYYLESWKKIFEIPKKWRKNTWLFGLIYNNLPINCLNNTVPRNPGSGLLVENRRITTSHCLLVKKPKNNHFSLDFVRNFQLSKIQINHWLDHLQLDNWFQYYKQPCYWSKPRK